MRNMVVILGTTASGKSALGVRLAKKFHGVVISADSRQVYRGLNTGTAKITKSEMGGVKHFLLDVASPRGQYSVARYVQDVQRVLRHLPKTTPVFLVGGSAYYIKAVTEPGSYSAVPPNLALRRRLAAKSTYQLIKELTKLDPNRARSIDPANRRRLERAIEIASSTPLSEGGRAPGVAGSQRIFKLGLQVPRPELYRRIDRRVDVRFKKIVTEVKKIHRSGLSWRRLESFGLEYRFTAQFVQGKITKTEAINKIKFGTHDFARRQLTWWRKENDIRWVRNIPQADQLARKFLQS